MKHIIILGDGMADWPIAEFGDRTILQNARKPYMDMMARKGRTGMLRTVPDGFTPGSEVANMEVMGYDVTKVFEGRGVLEAANIGVELLPGQMGMRCNIICVKDGNIKNHSAGHISTEEADELVQYLQKELGGNGVTFHTGIQYRHLLVIDGGNKQLLCTPPHDVPGQPFMPLLIKAMTPEAQPTADLLNELILKSQEILPKHPVNQKRVAEGKDPANSIWPWSPGYRPKMQTMSEMFPQIRRSSVISAVDLIKGIGHYAGMNVIDVEGATGLADTNYENKAKAAIKALETDDFVYVHVEAPDEAGHEGNFTLKNKTVEDLDSRLIGPIYEAVKDWDEPVAFAVLPDHPTPCAHRTHTSDPIPFLVYYPGIEADNVQQYDEESCKSGAYGQIEFTQFIKLFLES
ncbi:MAG: cofactor-independent phosphoglycerate mutase [Bacteroidaceae bacterium]|nr:cofactor-independent phosphoglycerate mutase [Bacteroidaceae bacterium]